MYKQVKTDVTAVSSNDKIFYPVATLEDEYGGKCQIHIDDHCYVLKIRGMDGKYHSISYIFSEALEVFKKLPSL